MSAWDGDMSKLLDTRAQFRTFRLDYIEEMRVTRYIVARSPEDAIEEAEYGVGRAGHRAKDMTVVELVEATGE